MSKGEDKIVDLLNSAGVAFTREKTFSDLKHGSFRYDFYLPNIEGAPALVEYNGEQHYYFIKHFYKKNSDFQKVQEHDRRKISYALANDIPIYIIPYWELPQITNANQLLNKKFLARTRWKNDDDYESFLHQKN